MADKSMTVTHVFVSEIMTLCNTAERLSTSSHEWGFLLMWNTLHETLMAWWGDGDYVGRLLCLVKSVINMSARTASNINDD